MYCQKQEQNICFNLYRAYGQERVCLLNYEALVSTPEDAVRSLCNLLDIPFHEKMLKFYESDTSKRAAASGDMWKNLQKPIMKDDTQKFLNEMTSDEIELFEWIAKDTLTELGYPLYSTVSNKSLISKESIEWYDKENAALKKQFMQTAPKSDIEKRGPQLQIINAIKNREKIL